MSPRRGGGCLGDALSDPPPEAHRRQQQRPARSPEASPGGGGLEEPRTRRRPRSLAAAAAAARCPRRGRRAPFGEDEGGGGRPLHDQPVGAAGPEPLGPRDGAEEPHGDVVLDLPLGSLLLSVCPWCCGSVDVCDAAEAQAGESHLCHCRQHWVSSFCDRSHDH
ncbi:transmembrane protein 170B isoform X1 [Sus scrofa]|uniref:transmembrane protein 170B isoform X1 n=1 Tax=Sus scrofa TaxID=9823 RepID=UPI000A2B8FC2|nr:transmembrane protein 170B isoform X1 [Sus scrofa]